MCKHTHQILQVKKSQRENTSFKMYRARSKWRNEQKSLRNIREDLNSRKNQPVSKQEDDYYKDGNSPQINVHMPKNKVRLFFLKVSPYKREPSNI